jgi:hypothetical protein
LLLQQAINMVPRERPQDAQEFARALAEAFARPLLPMRISETSEPSYQHAEHDSSPLVAVADEPSTNTDIETAPRQPAEGQMIGAGSSGGNPGIPGGGPPRRLTPSHQAQRVGDRVAHFISAGVSSVDLRCAGGAARIRVTLLQLGGEHTSVHVRGLDCFVRKSGGRPTSGTQITGPGAIELLAKDRTAISGFRVLYGNPAAGHSVFALGDCNVAIGTEECPHVVALDFGPGAELFFVFQPTARAGRDPLGHSTKKLRTVRPS